MSEDPNDGPTVYRDYEDREIPPVVDEDPCGCGEEDSGNFAPLKLPDHHRQVLRSYLYNIDRLLHYYNHEEGSEERNAKDQLEELFGLRADDT